MCAYYMRFLKLTIIGLKPSCLPFIFLFFPKYISSPPLSGFPGLSVLYNAWKGPPLPFVLVPHSSLCLKTPTYHFFIGFERCTGYKQHVRYSPNQPSTEMCRRQEVSATFPVSAYPCSDTYGFQQKILEAGRIPFWINTHAINRFDTSSCMSSSKQYCIAGNYASIPKIPSIHEVLQMDLVSHEHSI